jgi:hypothetical protein
MFVENRPQRKPELMDYHKQLSRDYFLEEAACVAILVKKGISVSVYPGTLRVFNDLCRGLFPDAPEEFKNMISVGLHLTRR